MAETGSEKSKRGGDGDRHVVRSNPTEGGGAKRKWKGERDGGTDGASLKLRASSPLTLRSERVDYPLSPSED